MDYVKPPRSIKSTTSSTTSIYNTTKQCDKYKSTIQLTIHTNFVHQLRHQLTDNLHTIKINSHVQKRH
eukprot:UN04206